MENKKIVLARRPDGMVNNEDFEIKIDNLPELQEGQFLIENEYISLDPAMRGWMNAGTTYIPGVEIGAVMRGFAAGKIIQSNHPDYKEGEYASGLLGVQQYAISDGKGITHIPETSVPLSNHLGILGMPGMTAYFGLLRKGEPKEGETVLGSTVGQIAKIKGCKVVGTAGTKAKCDYLINECGFDAAINYKEEDIAAAVKRTCPEGIHIVYDNVGGSLLDILLANLARGARVVICGAISQYNSKDFYGPKNYMKIVTARGYINGIIVFDYISEYPIAVKQMSEWIAQGKLKIKEHIEEGLDNFPDTLKMLFTGENFGKLILKV